MKQYKDDKIFISKNAIESFRMRPTYIVGELGYMGVLHLCKEIIDNNRDECSKPESPGSNVNIFITDDYIISSDDGRGIPTDLLQVVHETNQAGSNMTRAHGTTAGENGTGSTAYTAMASELVITTTRPSEKKRLTLRYNEGVLVERIEEEYTGKEHGMMTKFSPSKKILGVNKIPVEMLITWLKDFEYTLPNNIHITYQYKKEAPVHIVHKSLSSYFNTVLPTNEDGSLCTLCEPLTVTASGDLTETVQLKTYDRHFDIEVSFVYATPSYKGEDARKSWMNMIYTMNNGTHINGAINGLIRYLTEKVIKKNKKYEGEDLKRDILAHLQVAVKASCNMANMFSSQAKAHVFPKCLLTGIADAVYNELGRMNQARIDDLVDVVIANNRVRREGEKMRTINSSTKQVKSWSKPDEYIPCSSVKTPQEKELFLVEGKSAGGGIRSARNAMFQAILQFRGKSLNVFDQDLPRVLSSKPWLNLIKILGCGIGPTFDIKKLNFGKIIITTDADIDGYHIRVGFCTFFAKYMPEIITSGKLYIAEPPLYKLVKGKDVSYVASQTEYIQSCIDSISDMEISFSK